MSEVFQGPVSAQMLRMMPSPQQSIAVVAKPPPWVAEAWSLQQRPSQFLRKMMSILGADSMGLIGHLPMSVQVSLLTTLLVWPGAWPDPQQSLKNMLAVVKELPPLPLALSSRPLQRSGKPLVVLQFGGSMGAEWLNLRLALENLKGEFPDVRLEARHALLGDAGASAFYDAIASAEVMEGSAEVHKDAASMASVVVQQLPAWKNADSTVLVLVTLPVPNNKYGGPVEGPQWHTKPANALWDMFLVLRALAGLPESIRSASHRTSPAEQRCLAALGPVLRGGMEHSQAKNEDPHIFQVAVSQLACAFGRRSVRAESRARRHRLPEVSQLFAADARRRARGLSAHA